MESTFGRQYSFTMMYVWLIAAMLFVAIALALPPASRLYGALISSSTKATAWRIDQAEKGTLPQKATMSDMDIFELEKRAFFSKVRRSDRYEQELTEADLALRMPSQSI